MKNKNKTKLHTRTSHSATPLTCVDASVLLQMAELLKGAVTVDADVLADVGVHQGMLRQLTLGAEPFQTRRADV